MVKKFIYRLEKVYSKLNFNKDTEKMLLDFNYDLHDLLKQHKNNISAHYWTKKWDRYKKYANDYELVFTSGYGYPSISRHIPISRSYFKLWEILTDNVDSLNLKTDHTCKTCVFLAEGPGGFIEAFCNYRHTYVGVQDNLYGITLLSSDKNIPSWKISNNLVSEKSIKLLRGVDNTGSLYNIKNIDNFIEVIGKHQCDLVTADGGFDFSNDFNNQEEQSIKLIVAEILTCIQLQKQGGNFVIKLYDIHSFLTIQLLYILKELYDHITFIKPLSSRPANSEKYLLCCNFKGTTHAEFPFYVEQLTNLLNKINTYSLPIKVPSEFIYDVIEYNAYYILRQIIQINKTICFIDLFKNDKDDVNFLANLKVQLTKAIKWCNKYNISINLETLRYYKQKL